MTVVDFRARPNVPEYAQYLYPRLDAIAQQTRGSFGTYRAEVESVDGFVERLDRTGIDIAVFAARSRAASGAWALTNDSVADAVRQHPSRIVGFGGIDLSDPTAAAREIGRVVEELGLRGVCVDPFQIGAAADDDRLRPVYALAQDLGIAVVVTLGGMPGIDAPLSCGRPLALDVVAREFPALVIVGSHAGWPFPLEMVAVAWRRENVYFENSFYHRAPGADVLVDAANTMVGHKALYASAYPFADIVQALADTRALGYEPRVLGDVLGDNALRLLQRIGALPGGT